MRWPDASKGEAVGEDEVGEHAKGPDGRAEQGEVGYVQPSMIDPPRIGAADRDGHGDGGDAIEPVVALFGGEYQEGVLTAYCYVEDVAHIELNGHILVPLQNIASLHCSSRCDAPEDDWPPRGLEQEDGN